MITGDPSAAPTAFPTILFGNIADALSNDADKEASASSSWVWVLVVVLLLLGIAAAGAMYYRWSNNRRLDSLFKGGAQSRSISVKQRASITNPTYAASEQSEHVTTYDTTDGAGYAFDHGGALNNPAYAGPSTTYAVPMETGYPAAGAPTSAAP